MNDQYKLPVEPIARPEAIVAGEGYRFTVLTECLIRLEYQQEGRFVDAPTQTVLCRDFPVPQYRVIDQENSLEIVTEKLHLYYDKKPFSRDGLRIELKEGFFVYGSVWNYGDKIDDLKGTARTLDCVDGATELEQGLMSRSGFTVLDDSHSAQIAGDQWPVAKNGDSIDLYFFGYGHDYMGCLRDFYRLSGPTPLLPRFALGNWWSRYYPYSEESYLALMEKFREKELPFSTAVIDMDWHLVDIPRKYGSGWTGYTWNPKYFPDPKRFMDKLHDMGMRVTLNVHPADGVRGHEEAYLEMAKELGIDYENEDKIPFDAGSRAFLEAYFKYLHHPNEERGVDFWWLDWQQGSRGSAPGIDTLWMLNHLHYLDSGREGKWPLTFSRYAGPGSHRYPIGFSGDSYSTWDSLDFQPYFTANASNVGYSWWSHDIGGHMEGRRDDELAVRWVQFGVFSPIMRLHSTSNEFYSKEPWTYVLPAEKAMSEFLRLRHKLIPYLYAMNYRTNRDGLPLMRPMYYQDDVVDAYNVPNEYWFGTEMIVCPITKPADPGTLLAGFEAWLPEGDYIDLFTGRHYRGGRKLNVYRPLDQIPVFVKAGGIIPMAKDYMRSHLENPAMLEIHVFNGEDGSFDLYEDDLTDRAGESPAITRIRFRAGREAAVSVEILADPNGVIPANRSYEIHIHGIEAPEGEYAYDEDAKELTVTLVQPGSVTVITPTGKIAGTEAVPALYRLLQRAQIPYSTKTMVYDTVRNSADPARLLAQLQGMKLEGNLLEAVTELIVAGL